MKKFILAILCIVIFSCEKKNVNPTTNTSNTGTSGNGLTPTSTTAYYALFDLWGPGVRSVTLSFILSDASSNVVYTQSKTFNYNGTYTLSNPLYASLELPGVPLTGSYSHEYKVIYTGVNGGCIHTGSVSRVYAESTDPQSMKDLMNTYKYASKCSYEIN